MNLNTNKNKTTVFSLPKNNQLTLLINCQLPSVYEKTVYCRSSESDRDDDVRFTFTLFAHK